MRLRIALQRIAAPVAVSGAFAVAACGSPSSPAEAAVPTESAAAQSLRVTGAASTSTRITKVLTIVEENHSLAEARRGMPYLTSLGNRFGYATGYRAIRHPSLPNYLAIFGGDTFGVTDDADPSLHPVHAQSVFGAALAAGKTARVYAEGMTSDCQAVGSGRYAVRHAPWPYFTTERSECVADDVPTGNLRTGRLARDIRAGTLPTAGFIAPDLCDDAHDCALAHADGWLRTLVPEILAGPDFRSGHLAVVITMDENDGSPGKGVLTVVLAKGLSHKVARNRLNHYSLNGFYDAVIGTKAVRHAVSAPSFARAFGLTT